MKILILSIVFVCLLNVWVNGEEFEEVQRDEEKREDSLPKRVLEKRIVNGQVAGQHAWPWQVSLEFNQRGFNGRLISTQHFCGGSLINSEWVLTAAHCFNEVPANPAMITVTIGMNNKLARQFGIPMQRRMTISVLTIHFHPGWNRATFDNDFALLQLGLMVPLSYSAMFIALPSPGSAAAVGQACWITGWGRLGLHPLQMLDKKPELLLEAQLKIAPTLTCSARHYRDLGKVVNPNNMICAGGQGRSGCQGDSGGPFACFERGRWVLRGVVSWGSPVCDVTSYTVFARVTAAIGWIEQVVCSNPKWLCPPGTLRVCSQQSGILCQTIYGK